MVRGYIWFRCPKCGNIFKDLDIEDSATIYSVPMPCPKCGTKSQPATLLGLMTSLVRKILH